MSLITCSSVNLKRLHYVRFHHMSQKTRAYPCDFADCNFSADNPTHLKRHKVVHSREKGFRCTVAGCEKQYTRLDNLRRHVEGHDGVSIPFPQSFGGESPSQSSPRLQYHLHGFQKGSSSF
jgi:uncharacterized Zn-finger protein